MELVAWFTRPFLFLAFSLTDFDVNTRDKHGY